MESIKFNSTILLALIVILSTHSFMVDGQIYKKTDKGFDIDIGPIFQMKYDQNNGKFIDLSAVLGLVKFGYDKKPGDKEPKVNVDIFGRGNIDRQSKPDNDYVYDIDPDDLKEV
ncbi:uncharacterized protein LOC113798607 [Dermatophagoides pteronyssinus]|uniref:uncharacterized protein LOC113798607 n=1 Tax=Dermatophagoides pteronyssinus TaxID=6956 RepID=UPI003F676C98